MLKFLSLRVFVQLRLRFIFLYLVSKVGIFYSVSLRG